MTTVAVVAHQKKTLGGGLDELRSLLAHEGVEPLWYEVPKSRKAPAAPGGRRRRAPTSCSSGAATAPCSAASTPWPARASTLAILPAGTANLLATNLGIPKDLEAAVDVGLHGARRPLDVGVVNGERFAVMAGAGFDAVMIRDADGGMKDQAGRLAYVWTGAKERRASRPSRCRSMVDGDDWFEGEASCVLVGNVGTISGGIAAFARRRARRRSPRGRRRHRRGTGQWSRVLGRMAAGKAERSPLVRDDVGADASTSARRQDRLRARRRRTGRDEAAEDPGRAGRHPGLRPAAAGSSAGREHRQPGARDVGAHRRRRPADAAAHRPAPAAGRRLPALRVADGFSHARSLAFTIVARARAGR